MKKLLIILISFFATNYCTAQETVTVRKTPNDFYTEKYEVLKSDPTVKQGLYQALYRRKIALASGTYTNNVKTGIWHFLAPTGELMENFDYNTKTLIYEAPDDTATDLKYFVDKTLDNSDRFTKPLKIGGKYFGYIPYLLAFVLPFDTSEVNTDSFDAEIELLISPLGNLADYKVHILSKFYNYEQTTAMSLNLFNEEDKHFVPATINGEPVTCRIKIRCFVTSKGILDLY